MSGGTSAAVATLVAEAREIYRDNPAVTARLDSHARRLEEPLRVALVGMVKAGKSTLLNAIIGEEIAPTDAGECTKVVTWFQYADTPSVTLYPMVGEPRSLRVVRARGQLTFDMGDTLATDVSRLVVQWPAKSLREMTLIDTPGIASVSGEISARSTGFLLPDDAPSEADAVLYLLRHLHEADLDFLARLRDKAGTLSGVVNALVVLSRADEVGAGRIDSLLSAAAIAERYRQDDQLRGLASGVVPIAGLLAQSARSLKRSEFTVLAEFASLDRKARERLLVSADRFVAPTEELKATPAQRASLLERFGLFGIRMAAVLINNGANQSKLLARDLARRSGLDELLGMLAGRFQSRSSYLKADATLDAVERLLDEHPVDGEEGLRAAIERIRAGAHELQELTLLGKLGRGEVALEDGWADEASRIVGAAGVTPVARMGLAGDASADQIAAAAREAIDVWRIREGNPLTHRAAVEVCRVVIRSCEGVMDDLLEGSGGQPLGHLVLASEPRAGGRQEAGYQRRAG